MSRSQKHVGERLTELLGSIERASELEQALEERGRRAEAKLAAYNGALLFAAGARAGESSVVSTFSASATPAPRSAPLRVPPAWVGVNAFIHAHLRNSTPVVIGGGWNLRLTVERDVQHVETAESSQMRSRRCTRLVCLPMQPLSPDGTTTVSFPLTLESHAPLSVTLQMQFYEANHESRVTAHRLSHTVARNVVLDLLSFSTSVKVPTPGIAHRCLRTARMLQALGNESSEEPLPASCRLLLPVPVETLTMFAGRRRSLLGTDFNITVTNNEATLRAPPAMLPFLRAAVLRRCLNKMQRVAAPSREASERWEREIADAADSCMSDIFTAQGAIDEVRVAVKGGVESWGRDEDHKLVDHAITTLDTATSKWRLKARDVWRTEER